MEMLFRAWVVGVIMPKGDNEIGSVKTAFRVLEEMKEAKSMGVTEVAKALDIPKSTAYSHLHTLSKDGYLIVKDGQYRLSFRLLDLGHRSRTNRNLFELAKPKVDDLAEQTGEVVNLMCEEDGDGVYLYIQLGENAVKFDTYPGMRIPLYCTALGKAILARTSESKREAYLRETDLVAETENTITDPDALCEEFETIRERGYAIDLEERAPGIRCVAAPICDAERCIGSLSISGPVVRMQGERFNSQLPEQLLQITSEIELGFRYS